MLPLKETWAWAHIYQVLILLLFIQTSKSISKPDILDAAIFPAVASCGNFDSMCRRQKWDNEKRLKSDNRRELYPKCNNGDNCNMEYRHIGCNPVKNSKINNFLSLWTSSGIQQGDYISQLLVPSALKLDKSSVTNCTTISENHRTAIWKGLHQIVQSKHKHTVGFSSILDHIGHSYLWISKPFNRNSPASVDDLLWCFTTSLMKTIFLMLNLSLPIRSPCRLLNSMPPLTRP